MSSSFSPYIPFAPEIGAKYTLTSPDGITASFNDPTDPNYVGILTDVTGLDSADVRESGDVLSGADGGYHGDFFFGRRPITMTGLIVNAPDAATRAARMDLITRATNAMRGDAVLWWQNTASGSVPMQTWVRRQQPIRYSGGWVKTFQIGLVSQFPFLYSAAQQFQANVSKLPTNSNFEAGNTTSWFTSGVSALTAGATVSAVTPGDLTEFNASPSNYKGRVVTPGAAAHEGIGINTSVALNANSTYMLGFDIYGNTGGEVVEVVAGNTTVRYTLGSGVGNFVRFPFVAPSSAITPIVFRTANASASTFFVDEVSLTEGREPQYGNPTTQVAAFNLGNALAFPTITIYGAAAGPIKLTTTLGMFNGPQTTYTFQALPSLTLVSGDYITVDTLNHNVYNSSGQIFNQYIDFVNSTQIWPPLGTNMYGWATLTGAAYSTFSWRDTWL